MVKHRRRPLKPKTKPEPKTQIKLSLPKSLAEAFDTTRKEADQLGFDWNATMVEQLEKSNAEFSQFLAQRRAKLQSKPGLTPITANGPDTDRA
jgi:hypothetical protein